MSYQLDSKKAVALEYDQSSAPKVSASGTGEWAQEIIALARQYEVPLYENAALVEALSELEIGEEIPAGLYQAIAIIIAFAYRIRDRLPGDQLAGNKAEN